jgi:hypothetical protein
MKVYTDHVLDFQQSSTSQFTDFQLPEQQGFYLTPNSIPASQQMEDVRHRQAQQSYNSTLPFQRQEQCERQNEQMALYNQQSVQHHFAPAQAISQGFPLPSSLPFSSSLPLENTIGDRTANNFTPRALQNVTEAMEGNKPTSVWGTGGFTAQQGLSSLHRGLTGQVQETPMQSPYSIDQNGTGSIQPIYNRPLTIPSSQARKKRKVSGGTGDSIGDAKEAASVPITTTASQTQQLKSIRAALSYHEQKVATQNPAFTPEQVQKLAKERLKNEMQRTQPNRLLHLQLEEDRLRGELGMMNQRANVIHNKLQEIERLRRTSGWVNSTSGGLVGGAEGQAQIGLAQSGRTQPATTSLIDPALTVQAQDRGGTPGNESANIGDQDGRQQTTDTLTNQAGSHGAEDDNQEQQPEDDMVEYLNTGTP